MFRSLANLTFTLLLVVGIYNEAFADETFRIDGVSIVGNKRIETEAIKIQLKKHSGSLSRTDIDEEVKSLYQTGFFDQVTAAISNEGARSTLVYTLVEKPVVRKVFIEGNDEVESDDLYSIFRLGSNRFLDTHRIAGLKKAASSYYQGRGFFDASFEHSVVPVGDNQVDVTFNVDEGKRYKIKDIEFVGLKEIDDDDLEDVMETTTYKWWSSWLIGTGRLNTKMLENDTALLRQYLLDHGYVEGTIGDPEVEKKDGRIVIMFPVNEGRVFKIGKVTATGDLVEGSPEKTIEGISLEPEEIFSASTLREDTFKVSEKFTDQGYAFANVVPNTEINGAEAKVNLTYKIDKGQLVDINEIKIRGNAKTYDNVIRRELKVTEQQQYSSSKVKRSQELLQRLGYFEEVNISNEPTTEPDKVNLNVNVREASTGQVSVGAGYSTSDGPLLNARLSENNIMGTGRRVDLNVDVGTQRNNAALTFSDRRINDSFVSGGIEAYVAERDYLDFDRSLLGGSVTSGYPLEQIFGESAEDIAASLKYEYVQADISNIDVDSAAPLVIASEGETTASSITPSLVRNTINNPLNPSTGSKQVISTEVSGLGGEAEYYVLGAANQFYYPLIEGSLGKLVLSLRTRIDYGDSTDDNPFPLFKRYFPGGINSVRGYDSRSLGPKDEKGNEFGGSKQFVHNSELIFPLFESAGIRGVIFHDIGEAFDDEQSIEWGEMRQGWGPGLRWHSPLGPLRVEFGFPIAREPNEDNMQTMFSFGGPF